MDRLFSFGASGAKLRDRVSLGMALWLLTCLVCHPLLHAEFSCDGSGPRQVRFCIPQEEPADAVLHAGSPPCPLCSGVDGFCSPAERPAALTEKAGPDGKCPPADPPRLSLPGLPPPRAPPAA